MKYAVSLNKEKSHNLRVLWSQYGTLVILVCMVVVMGILSPKIFLRPANLLQVVLQSTITMVVGCGEFFAIMIGGIDLSVGSTLALSGMVTAKLMVSGINVFVAILLGLILGASLGLLNGVMVTRTGLHPFIITLGTQSIYRGLTLVISGARPVYGFPSAFSALVGGRMWSIPVPVIIAVVYAIILSIMLKKFTFGRNLYAIGGNTLTAWYSGIHVHRHKVAVFILSGFSAALAGIIMNVRVGSAEPTAGVGYETYAIAAVIIGGASFFGGKGTIFGVMFGSLIIGVINNGLNLLNVSTHYQQIVMGMLIIIAVTLDKLVAGNKGKV